MAHPVDGNPSSGTHGVPHLESTLGQWPNSLDLSEAKVTEIISRGAYSVAIEDISGISRYDGTQIAANSPCQDQYFHGRFECQSKSNDCEWWMAWAVLDGHSGPQTAELLRAQLLPMVKDHLQRLMSSANGSSVSEREVECAVVRAFLELDHEIIQTAQETMESEMPMAEKAKKLAPAYAGSCALLALWSPKTNKLHVACTGDSRAVLGQQTKYGNWKTVPLSVDQNAFNKDEIARIRHEHPGEEKSALKNGRVLGLGMTRAFGDGRWKWHPKIQHQMNQKFFGPKKPVDGVQTPPYITAGPVVTSTWIDPTKPSFLILATDGLWDCLSNRQATTLVDKWLQAQGENETDSQTEPIHPSSNPSLTCKKFNELHTTVRDENAAVHLVRNALGGSHHDLVAGRLAWDVPFARRVRDDITVQVVFFNMPDL